MILTGKDGRWADARKNEPAVIAGLMFRKNNVPLYDGTPFRHEDAVL